MGKIDNFRIFEERVYIGSDMRQNLTYLIDKKDNKLAKFLIKMIDAESYKPDFDYINVGAELNKISFIARNRVPKNLSDIQDIFDSDKRQTVKLGRLIRKVISSIATNKHTYKGDYLILNTQVKSQILIPDRMKDYVRTDVETYEYWTILNKLNTLFDTPITYSGVGTIGDLPSGYNGYGDSGDGGQLPNDSMSEYLVSNTDRKSKVTTRIGPYSGGILSQICKHFNNENYLGISIEYSKDIINNDNRFGQALVRMNGEIEMSIDAAFSDAEIETFVNEFVACSKMFDFDKSGLTFKVVKGADIAKYYLDKNYYGYSESADKFEKGVLWNSCMRYARCQRYLNIYTQNNQVSLLVLVTSEDKVVGRALLWQLTPDNDSKIYMDRAYTIHDSDVKLFNNYAIKEGYVYYTNGGPKLDNDDYDNQLFVKLNNTSFDLYPYMDTLCYLDGGGDLLSSSSEDFDYDYELNDTYGHWDGYGGDDDDDY